MRPTSLICVVGLLALAGCRKEGAEARIQRAFDASVQALEAGDASGATAALSPKFSGPEGMDRAGARFFLGGILRREKVGVTVLSQKLEVDRSQALQSVDLMVTGRFGGGLVPDESSRRSLVIRWELRDGAWLMREIQEGS